MSDSRFLITTSDLTTWKNDRPVVFLGEWCRIPELEPYWRDLDASVVAPTGANQFERDRLHKYGREIEERLMARIVELLNAYHGVDYEPRFWIILVQHWLHRFVDVTVNRTLKLRRCLSQYRISGTSTYDYDDYDLVSFDTAGFVAGVRDEKWNNVLCAEILKCLPEVSVSREVVGPLPNVRPWRCQETASRSRMGVAKRRARQVMASMVNALARDTDAVFATTHMPRKEEYKLFARLHQLPIYWIAPQIDYSAHACTRTRKSLEAQLTPPTDDAVEAVVTRLIFKVMPICYLEGFRELQAASQNAKTPDNPKFIFTSNSFYFDEAFKLWVAQSTRLGVPYFVGQHGASYGTSRHIISAIEEETSDKFLTWGWTDGMKTHVPAYVLTPEKRPCRNANNANALLIELHYPIGFELWDTSTEYQKYLSNQICFVDALPQHIRDRLVVRLYKGSKRRTPSEHFFWKRERQKLAIDDGDRNIAHLISESRVAIFSYDSTGLLETLSSGVPTIAFWSHGLDHLRDSAVPYYKLLVDAGILHFDPMSAANKLVEVWDQCQEWWNQPDVRSSREQFCNRFARRSDSLSRDLFQILTAVTPKTEPEV